MSAPQLLNRLSSGPRAERWAARLGGTEVELRVVKPLFAQEVGRFLDRTAKVARLDHPSLRMVRGAVTLPDGRPAAVMSQVDWPTLTPKRQLPVDDLLTMALELADALHALHEAGLSLGVIDVEDIYPGQPALLDASLCGLAQPGDTPQADVQMLARALHGAVADEKNAAPVLALLERATVQPLDAKDFIEALRTLRTRLAARTPFDAKATVLEVIEPDLSGLTLEHWTLERVLGEGAMARVYLATDQRDGSQAAVKVLKQEHLGEPEFIKRFVQEVRAAQTLSHPHVVKMSGRGDVTLGPGQRCVFCVMEVLNGRPLADAMHEPFGVVRAARIVQQAAVGLHSAHQAGIVHRDIKPENLFLLNEGLAESVKVLDFGVAKLLKPIDGISRVGTRSGVVVGTPEYMAPEQALGKPTDARCDVYALGVVLYELLSGQVPFKGDTFGAVVVAMTRDEVQPLPPMTRAGERLPPGLSGVVLKAMARDPDERYPTAEALALALEPWVNPRWSTEKLPAVPSATTEPQEPVHVDETQLEAAVRPSRTPLVVALVVLLVMLAGGGVLFLRDGTPPPTRTVTQVVSVKSTPSGAHVSIDEKEVGVTPFTLDIPPGKNPMLDFELEGYAPWRTRVAEGDSTVDVKLQKLRR